LQNAAAYGANEKGCSGLKETKFQGVEEKILNPTIPTEFKDQKPDLILQYIICLSLVLFFPPLWTPQKKVIE
jgi:hypothetical protein